MIRNIIEPNKVIEMGSKQNQVILQCFINKRALSTVLVKTTVLLMK